MDTSLVLNILAKDKASKVIDSIGKKTQLALAGAGFAIGAFATKSVMAASDDQKAAAILATTLKNSTGARARDVSSVENWISKMTLATGVADDELRPALGTLVRATHNTAEAQNILQVAMDASAATGKPLETISLALAKAQGGNVTALGKLGIATKDAHGKTLSFAQVMVNMQKTFSGSQAAATDSFSGRVQVMKNAFNEATESVGYGLLPIMTKLATFATGTLVPAITATANWFQANAAWVTPLAIGLGSVIAAVLLGSKAMALFRAAQESWLIVQKLATAAQWLWNAAMSANPIGLVVLAVVGLIAAVVLAYRKVGWFRDGVQAAFHGVVAAGQWIWDMFKKIPGWIGSALSTVGGIILAPFRAGFNLVSDVWNKTLGKISFKLPSWIPGLGGKGFSFPTMPHFAAGTSFAPGGLALVGERGPEVVGLPRGSQVFPTGTAPRGAGGDVFHIYEATDARGTALEVARRQQLLGAV